MMKGKGGKGKEERERRKGRGEKERRKGRGEWGNDEKEGRKER